MSKYTMNEERIGHAMNEIIAVVDDAGFDAARDALSTWDDLVLSDQDMTGWASRISHGLRHVLDRAEDDYNELDTCHVSIVWPHRGSSIAFRMEANGADGEFAEAVRQAVERALAGRGE